MGVLTTFRIVSPMSRETAEATTGRTPRELRRRVWLLWRLMKTSACRPEMLLCTSRRLLRENRDRPPADVVDLANGPTSAQDKGNCVGNLRLASVTDKGVVGGRAQ